MAVTLQTNALTTVALVKARLSITHTDFDTLFIRLINASSDWIEGECNRKFKQQTYINQVYSARNAGMQYVALEQSPIASVSSAQYRAGTPSSPSWTDFIADQWEIVEEGRSGLIRIYDAVPYGVNAVRFTYLAGYLIDPDNQGTGSNTLPTDLIELCERMVVKAFKQRDSKGKTDESFDGSSVTWARDLDDDEKSILARYRRLPAFV